MHFLKDLFLIIFLIFVNLSKINCNNDLFKVTGTSHITNRQLDFGFFRPSAKRGTRDSNSAANDGFIESDNINLSKYSGCVQHVHRKEGGHYHKSYHATPYLNISTGDETSNCIQIFENSDCSGPSIQLLNVKYTHLMLNWIGRNPKEKEKLLNLNIIPKSFRKCQLEVKDAALDMNHLNYLKEKYCHAETLIKIRFQGGMKTINYGQTDQCIEVHKPSKLNTLKIFPDLSLFIINKEVSEDFKHLGICIELFPESECGGDAIRFYIPNVASTLAEDYFTSSTFGPSRKIWEYYSNKAGVPFIDTDVKSLQKCSFCLHNHHSAREISSTPAINEIDESILNEDANCHFSNCQPISVYLDRVNGNNARKSESGKCYFLFKDTSCSPKAFLKITELDSKEFTSILLKYEQFARWSLASCDSLSVQNNSSECLIPLESNQTLKTVFPNAYSDEIVTSKGQSPLINKTVLTFGAILGLILLALVIIIAFRLSKEEI